MELVPGDIIEVPNNMILPCDLIILTGSAIMNESMLTGESVPIIKTALPYTDDIFNFQTDSKYILYSGSKVITTRKQG